MSSHGRFCPQRAVAISAVPGAARSYILCIFTGQHSIGRLIDGLTAKYSPSPGTGYSEWSIIAEADVGVDVDFI